MKFRLSSFWPILIAWVVLTVTIAALILGCQTSAVREDYCVKEDDRGRCVEWRFTPAKRKP